MGLAVWQKAHGMVLQVSAVPGDVPKAEPFGLTARLRRTALSVPTTIAEGCGRSTEFLALPAHDLKDMPDEAAAGLLNDIPEVKRMLSAFTTRLRQAASLNG